MEDQLLDIINSVDINSIKSIKQMASDIKNITPIYDGYCGIYIYYPCIIYHTKRLIIVIRNFGDELRRMAIVCNNKCIYIEVYNLKWGVQPIGFYIDETIDETMKILLERFTNDTGLVSTNIGLINYFCDYKSKCDHEPTIDWLVSGLKSTKSARNI